ncbi:SET and MYND domain-containing protein 4-like [Sitodiplosis mosellana]|uniref:SET and MYND domain-containing protein 4-like n=1 Tax=Sitodiplosis mosellana TaxID=263140 RepID=UPI002444EB95|nr:SET and MYND domain-containing protein 4-like [Sitodiplosis mosellana]
MLWVKESNKKNALFVDIFKSNKLQRPVNFIESKACSPPRKSDTVALRKRKEGNELFGQREWAEAMEMYNESLCFAKNGSKHISLAYANRSSCFLNMKLYNECLIDIELAKEAGYPMDLMEKLNQRKEDCLKSIEKAAKSLQIFEPKLSYEADEKFPCMANVLKFEQGDDGDYALCAKEDIDVGQTIVVESAFVKCLLRYGRKCSICLKGNTNLVPCENCATAMFCSNECKVSFLHKYECGLRYSEDESLNGGILEAARAIILGVNAFTTVDQLMEFVEQTISSDPNELLDSLIDEQSKYRAFLKLPLANDDDDDIFIAIAYCTYKFILNIPGIKAIFESRKHRRFLMHFVTHCMKVTSKNSLQEVRVVRRKEYALVYTQTGAITKYLKHSCAPNATMSQTNGNLICVTVRPVKMGERLLISCYDMLLDSKETRQRQLWENKQFICQCTRCEGHTATLAQRKRIASDPDFHDIIFSYPITESDVDKLPQMIAKCEAVSRKYGDVIWCDEIGRVINIYIKLLNFRMSGLF